METFTNWTNAELSLSVWQEGQPSALRIWMMGLSGWYLKSNYCYEFLNYKVKRGWLVYQDDMEIVFKFFPLNVPV